MGRQERYLWIQVCNLTGETNEVYLTEEEKLEIERQPQFRGWPDSVYFKEVEQ